MSSVSGIDNPIGDADPPAASSPAGRPRGRKLPRITSTPLMPETGAGGAPLTAVIAVISALASLALAAFIVIAMASGAWTDELSASVTIQVKGADAAEIAANTDAANAILSAAPGVLETRIIDSAESAKLLEPWLGRGNTDALTVPALIEVTLNEAGKLDLANLERRLAEASPNLALDDHENWNRRLVAAARSGQALAFGVFALIMVAACAISIFAARAGLSANAEVVSLLHLVGATDDFVANQVQRRFTIIGLRGSLIGLSIALFILGLLSLATRARGGDSFFLPGLGMGVDLALPMLLVPVAICLVTAIAARLTVLKILRETY